MMPDTDLEACAPGLRALGTAQLITRDTNLRVDSFNAAAGVALTIVARILTLEGTPTLNTFDHIPNTDRTIKTTTHVLTEGWLVSLQVFASGGTPRRGQCYVRAELVSGFTGALTSIATLLQGYVQDTSARAWPGSPVEASPEGPGVVRTILGANPAAGVEISETVPANARWELRTFTFTLVTSIVAANRRPTLLIDDGANILWRVGSNVDQIASQTSIYEAGIGAPFATLDVRVFSLPLPTRLALMGGYRIRTSTAAIDAGDDYAAPIYNVEEYIED